MNAVFTYSLYGIAVVLLVVSFAKSREKTVQSLKRAWKMFINILPQFVAILLLVGLLLAVVTPEIIQRAIGAESGFWGTLIASVLGAVASIPVLIAFPIAAELLRNGAGMTQIAVFVSTLTTVGLVTVPLESKYLGKRLTITRNVLSYLYAFIVAYVMGALLT